MNALTDRRQQVLDFLASYTDEHGVGPSVREVAQRFKFNVNAARQHLMKLVEKGRLIHRPHKSRAWIVPRTCPHCGGTI